MAEIDTAALKDNWALVASSGPDEVAHFFYAHLFVHHPETRDMFAPAMTRQRNRLVTALGRVVSDVDHLEELVPFLQDLGRDHRKFGALSAHYPAVGASLVATLRHFSYDAWTDRLQEDWVAAYGIVADTMIAAADEAAKTMPPWWDAEVVASTRPTFDIAVLRVRVDGPPLPYVAGQSVAVEPVDLRPREWRFYSPANAPREDSTIDLHVRLVPGGPVSTVLARSAGVGERLRLGPPIGALTLDPDADRPLLLVAGGTGIAPLLALVEQVGSDGGKRPTHLFFGVRSGRELYLTETLAALDRRHPWLEVTTAVSDDESFDGPQGLISDIVVAAGDWSGHDAYVCGSPAMVEATVKQLVAHGVPETSIRFDEFGES